MNADVVGKVHNTRLPLKDGIMALFEAISNSIQSIEDAKIKDGKILIELIRRKSLFDGQEDSVLPIDSIKVTDNGVGFIEENLSSFLSSDSTYKLTRGGKGIGRFTWLKVFDHVAIESVFMQGNLSLKKYFEFVNHKDAIVNEKDGSAGAAPRGTIVSLMHLKEGYLEKFPRELDDIADQIIEHLIIRLISQNCPSILLRDTSIEPSIEIDLNNRFNHEFLIDKDADSFELNKFVFNVGLLKVRANSKSLNSIYLSGNDRIVTNTPLSKYIPTLTQALTDIEIGEAFCIKALVTSSYLDMNVNNERTEFSLKTGNDDDDNLNGSIFNEITLKQIENRTSKIVKHHFSYYINNLRAAKKATIEKIIYDFFPQFIPILNYDSVIDSIPQNHLVDKNKLNIALQKAKYDILIQTKKEVIDVQIQMDNISDVNATPETLQEYKRGFDALVKKLTNITKTELSEYVLHRRVLLDIFEKVLSKRDDGKYPWEEEIHNLIFPKGKSSDDMLGLSQNLWLIDERLSYHRFVASDQSLDKKKRSSTKPDLLVGKQITSEPAQVDGFDVPFAYSEESRFAAYDSMVILEFKRAMRTDYSGDKDPINQLIGYIREIRNGKAKHPNGRPIIVSNSCRFYAYLICDLTPELRVDIEEMHEFTPMVEGNGLFALKDKINSYIEVVSYDKILSDSAQRNQVLFEKLQIDFASLVEAS
ncbi:MAG TPA: hypothetical protein VF629_07015 [Hymenobacter sp.]